MRLPSITSISYIEPSLLTPDAEEIKREEP